MGGCKIICVAGSNAGGNPAGNRNDKVARRLILRTSGFSFRSPRMPLSDTSPAARKLQMQIEAAMTGEERLLEAFDMSLFARELAKAKIRTDHPDWGESQVAREILRLAFLPEPLPSGLR